MYHFAVFLYPLLSLQHKKVSERVSWRGHDKRESSTTSKLRKVCPQCSATVHVRRAVCGCGFAFPIKRKARPDSALQTKKQERADRYGASIVPKLSSHFYMYTDPRICIPTRLYVYRPGYMYIDTGICISTRVYIHV